MLKIPHELLELIKAHGQRSFPEECVGLLLGKNDAETRQAFSLIPLENSASSRQTEFALSDAELLRGESEAARQNLDVVGFYHSHADFEAVASEKDREFAIPGLSYPIVSVMSGKAVSVKSFAFGGERKKADFTEEEIVCL